jgi:peptide deformylase
MPILRKKAKPVTKIDDEFIMLIENMFYTMDHSSGIGLAAPQVNVDLSLAIVDISCIEKYKTEKPLILINPEVISSEGEIDIEEGCLSIPDIRFEISRPEKVYIKFNDIELNEVKMELNGYLSRVAQHEIDHLKGKLFIDYLNPDQMKEIKKKLQMIKKGKVDTEYPLHINSKNQFEM